MAEGQVLFVRGQKTECQDGKLGEESDSATQDEDIWDDTLLVQAYDRAVSLAKEEVVRRMGLEKESVSGNDSSTSKKHRRKKRLNREALSQWQVGAPCRAVYSVDGAVYEAIIDAILRDKGTCIIKYIGYGNLEEVPLKKLQPSQGQEAQKLQEAAAQHMDEHPNGMEMECSDEGSSKESRFRPKFGAGPKSTHGNKIDWQSRTVRPPGHGYVSPHFRPPHMPPMGVHPMVLPPPPPPHLTASFPEEDTEALSSMLMSWYMSGFHTGYYQGLKQAKNFPSVGGNFSRNSSGRK